MPRVKSFKSLSEICIDFILANQDSFCNQGTTIELENGGSLNSEKSAISPFDELPLVLLEELVNRLSKKTQINLYKFQIKPIHKLLMTPHLRTLDLTSGSGNCGDFSDVLHLAAIRSPYLETLRLGHCINDQQTEYLSLIPKFSKLRVLDIALSASGNECMQILGTHCADLRELHAKSSQVSNDGIRELCVTGHCKSIRVLNLTGCQVTTKGIQMALDNLPELKVLCHEFLVEGLAEIAKTALDRKLKLPQYSLSTLHVLHKTVYKSGSLKQSLLLCPNVTKVYLSLKKEGLKDADLLSLLSLKQICILEIRHLAQIRGTESEELGILERDLTFNRGVCPLLKKFGSSLMTLSLEGFFLDVDIPVIIELCPNLQTLSFWCKQFKITNSIEQVNMKQPVLKKLKNLYLCSTFYFEGHISPENLFALLSSPSLVLVDITNCHSLTDEILQRAANLHSFRKLEYLGLFDCPSAVTKKGIDIFMQETNPLKQMSVIDCRGITLGDCMDWKEKAIWIQKNWQFSFATDDFNYKDGTYQPYESYLS